MLELGTSALLAEDSFSVFLGKSIVKEALAILAMASNISMKLHDRHSISSRSSCWLQLVVVVLEQV